MFRVHEIKQNRISGETEWVAGYGSVGTDGEGYDFYGGGNNYYAKEPRYVLMQYTGLHDKNGKEIYEGDIVLGEDGEIGEIVWDSNYATWRNVYRKGPSVLCRNMPFPLWQSFYAENSHEHKPTINIIGNIYENTELLEGKS